MFNNTSKIMFAVKNDCVAGVILPTSDHLLTVSELDQKIEKAKSHVDHLSHQISHRNTHGGKSFRARQISHKDQLSFASDRLEHLQAMKGSVVKIQRRFDRLGSVGRSPSVSFPICGMRETDVLAHIKELKVAKRKFLESFEPHYLCAIS